MWSSAALVAAAFIYTSAKLRVSYCCHNTTGRSVLAPGIDTNQKEGKKK